jgi:hypothetical protein
MGAFFGQGFVHGYDYRTLEFFRGIDMNNDCAKAVARDILFVAWL